MDGVIEAGGIPVMLSLVNDDVSLKETAHYFDGFIFAGGEDLNPAIYNMYKLLKHIVVKFHHYQMGDISIQ